MRIGFFYDGPSAVSGAIVLSVWSGILSPWWLIVAVLAIVRVPGLSMEWKWPKEPDQ